MAFLHLVQGSTSSESSKRSCRTVTLLGTIEKNLLNHVMTSPLPSRCGLCKFAIIEKQRKLGGKYKIKTRKTSFETSQWRMREGSF